MRDVSARQRQDCPTLEGQPTLPPSTSSVRYIAGSPGVFGVLVARSFALRAGGTTTEFLLRRATQTPSPLFVNISRDYYLCPIRSTRRVYARCHQHLSLPSPTRLSLGVTRLNALLFHLSRGAVILADKSSDVISRRQQISRRLNVSQEGERVSRYLYVRRYIFRIRDSRA